MRIAPVALVVLASCAARSYRPTSRRIERTNGTIVDVDEVQLTVNHRGEGELTASARIDADTTVRAIRLAGAHDPACGGGKLARSVLVDGHPRSPISIPVEGAARVEATFAPADLPARLRDVAWIDVDSDDGCVRTDLLRADGTIEWVEAPRWAFGAALDGFGTQRGDERAGALASLVGERVFGRFGVGAALRAGRAAGRDPWNHVDLLGVAPVASVQAGLGRWMFGAAAAYDVLLPSASSDTGSDFLSLVQGPRLTLRAGYGGEPVPWHAFRTRHAASMFGVELEVARWSGAGWVVGGGLSFAVGR